MGWFRNTAFLIRTELPETFRSFFWRKKKMKASKKGMGVAEALKQDKDGRKRK